MKRFARWWRAFCRWFHRATGGYHHSEHAELVHAAEVKAEVETAQLRLFKHNMEIRHTMLCRMLDEELSK